MGHLMKTGLAAAALAVGLTGCSHAATLERPGPTAATTGASSASAHSTDVATLWAGTLAACPGAAAVGTRPPADPQHFGIAAAWPTDEAMTELLGGLHPGGSEAFTRDRLTSLRAALADTRRDLTYVSTYPDASEGPGEVTSTIKAWELARTFLVSEINSGATQTADGQTADVMDQVAEAKEEMCG